MTVDWAATGSMLQGLGTIAGVGAVIWGAHRAAETWKEQKRSERRMEMAERVITATHKARDALAYVRSPFHHGGELQTAEDQLKQEEGWTALPEGRQRAMRTAQVVFDRLKNVRDDRLAIGETVPLARAMFSTELEQALQALSRQFHLVAVDAETYADGPDGLDKDFVQKLRRGIYDVAPQGEVNEVTEAITSAVATIERTCEPALRLERLDAPHVAKNQPAAAKAT